MNAAAPHHLFNGHRWLCIAAAAASAALSLWAIHVDPVINNDGILYIQAARHFGAGEWGTALEVYKWPFYSLLISAVRWLGGLASGHAAYFLNAALYAFLVLGFIALVRALGGGKAALWSAAVIALGHPVLNEFRAFIIRDIGYWACYLWSLAYFFTYLRHRETPLLVMWLALGVLAFLFRIEGIVLLAVLPACLYVVSTGGRRAAAVTGLAVVGVLLVIISPLWHYLSEIGTSRAALVANPLQHVVDSWQAGAAKVLDRLDALQRDFPGLPGKPASLLAYLGTVLVITGIEAVKTLGVVFTGLAVYACWRVRQLLPARPRRWWLMVVVVQGLLVFLFVLSSFFLAERYPVGLALALLAIIPLAVEQLWEERARRGSPYGWRGAAVAALLAIEAVEGLDVATEKQYLKDAGLWLRANAAPGSSIYSNDRILVYYSGLVPGPGTDHTLQEAMSKVWTKDWRDYDYFVLVMDERDRRYEVALLQKIESKPVKTFASEDGDQVLVFRPES